ncbi:hypothetical protein NKH77_36770 [Streptomyces sp. M19]
MAALVLGVTGTVGGCGPQSGKVTDLGATGGTRVEGGTATMALPRRPDRTGSSRSAPPATSPPTTAPSRTCSSCGSTSPRSATAN